MWLQLLLKGLSQREVWTCVRFPSLTKLSGKFNLLKEKTGQDFWCCYYLIITVSLGLVLHTHVCLWQHDINQFNCLNRVSVRSCIYRVRGKEEGRSTEHHLQCETTEEQPDTEHTAPHTVLLNINLSIRPSYLKDRTVWAVWPIRQLWFNLELHSHSCSSIAGEEVASSSVWNQRNDLPDLHSNNSDTQIWEQNRLSPDEIHASASAELTAVLVG